jgi:hypothetical protein
MTSPGQFLNFVFKKKTWMEDDLAKNWMEDDLAKQLMIFLGYGLGCRAR